jgi:transcription antitermination protein NusB
MTDTTKPMTPRRFARQISFQFLYKADIEKLSNDNLESSLREHIRHFQVVEDQIPFIQDLSCQAVLRREEIDTFIQKHAKNWRIDRMSVVDRSILRLALAEMLTFVDIHPSITLDEAIELAKAYGDQESSGFINGILDALSKSEEIQAERAKKISPLFA